MSISELDGLRILLVEDEYLPAVEVAEMLHLLGVEVIGPVPDLDSALNAVSDELLDGAILDVNLRGEAVFPVAERLLARNTPFLFATGYDEWVLPEKFRDHPRLTKPFDRLSLERVTAAALRRVNGG
ncbi:response regulator [Rhodospirillaceae bacterium SYSU D60014]|uniref:response regulator n=1 Tax=Virgifigura deserti TaxID=2268457 RepID=UPI000E666900